MRYFVVSLMLLMVPVIAQPCTCGRIASIKDAIRSHPILVEAQVVSLDEENTERYGHQVLGVTLEVRKILKGQMNSETFLLEHWMCYASLYPELMKVGHTYVLPLSSAVEGKYELAGCSHSGLELIDGKLFTFEPADGIERRLKFYANYTDFVRQFQSKDMAPNKSLERTRGR